MKKIRFTMFLLVAISLLTAACAPAAPTVTLPPEVILPADAIKLSDVVPAMGEHWANPAQLPLGPIYLVYQGKVIGLEYMYAEDDMQDVSIPTPAGLEQFKALADLPVGATINHMDVGFMPKGHEGYEVGHWDVHLYFITPAEKNAITP